MSIKEMSRVWSDSAQKGNSLLLLLALADNANDAGYCFPGVEYLAHKTRMSERTVLRMIEELERAGEIAVDHRRTKGNRYMILSGCIDNEKDARIAKLTDNASPITAKKSVISDTVMGKTPTTVNKPSIESSTTKKTTEPRKRDSFFDVICEKSFGFTVNDQHKLNGSGGRVAKAANAVRKAYPDLTAADLSNFYEWWGRKDISAPRDPEKLITAIHDWQTDPAVNKKTVGTVGPRTEVIS